MSHDKAGVVWMLRAKDFIFDQAVHPETKLIYCFVDLADPDHWSKTVFPTPDSIRNRFINDTERPDVSNCAIAGGRFLAILVDCFDITADGRCQEQSKTVFEGLQTLWSVSPRKGFLAAGLLPGDPSRSHLLNTAVDYYTYLAYGLWKYYHSPFSGETQKKEICQFMHDSCTMIERDGTILATNGIPAPFCDIEAIRSDRSTRLLEMFLVAYDITGDSQWHDAYRRNLEQNRFARLRSMLTADCILYPYDPRDRLVPGEAGNLWGMLQSQTSLAVLVEIEEEVTVKAAYLEAMRLLAKLAENTPWTGYSDHGNHLSLEDPSIATQALEIVLLAQNRGVLDNVVTAADRAYQKELAELCRDVLSKSSRTDISALSSYWTAIKRGILTAD